MLYQNDRQPFLIVKHFVWYKPVYMYLLTFRLRSSSVIIIIIIFCR